MYRDLPGVLAGGEGTEWGRHKVRTREYRGPLMSYEGRVHERIMLGSSGGREGGKCHV